MYISISKEFEDYDFATFNGKRTLNMSAGARSLTLKPGDTFGYRSARNSVYIVMPERGLTYEYKITEDDFDRRIAPKSDEVKPAKAKKLFVVKTAPTPISRVRGAKKVPPTPPPMVPTKPKKKVQVLTKTQDQEEHDIVKMYGNPTRFARIKTTDDAIGYMIEVWSKVNESKCDHKLLFPTFIITKDMGVYARRMGYWNPGQHVLAASPRVFKAKEHVALTTIVHEIAHEAVTDIEKIPTEGNGGHGPVWSKWMRHFGLTPSRYSQFDKLEYYDDSEKEEIKKKQADVLDRLSEMKRQEEQQTERRILPGYYQLAQFYNAVQGNWTKGMIAGPNDKAMQRWNFVYPGEVKRFYILPKDAFFSLPKDSFTDAQIAALKAHAENVVNHIAQRRERRQKRALLRNETSGDF